MPATKDPATISGMTASPVRSSGQICRDLTCKRFKIVIVLGPSRRHGKLRVCHWQPSGEPPGGHWSAPRTRFESLLAPLPPDFDLTSRRGQVVAAAKRSVVNGLVRWQVGPLFRGNTLTEVHDVGTVHP
jgi:hypothetical protein